MGHVVEYTDTFADKGVRWNGARTSGWKAARRKAEERCTGGGAGRLWGILELDRVGGLWVDTSSEAHDDQ